MQTYKATAGPSMGVLLLLLLVANISAAQHIPPGNPRVWSMEELEHSLSFQHSEVNSIYASNGNQASEAAAKYVRNLTHPRHFELLKRLTSSESTAVGRAAIEAIGGIGHRDAADLLATILGDENRSPTLRNAAAFALAVCRDAEFAVAKLESSLAQIDEMEYEHELDKVFFELSLKESICRAKDPHFEAALIVWDGHRLQFRFFLDDIKAIRYGKYRSEPRNRFKLSRAAPDNFRTICDLLGIGQIVSRDVGCMLDKVVIIELNDGSSQRIYVDGNLFAIESRFSRNILVSCPGLREFLDWHCEMIDPTDLGLEED